MFTLNRRQVLLGTAGAAAAGLAMPTILRASEGERVVFATWAGIGADIARRTFGENFQRESGIETIVADVSDPVAVTAASQGSPQHNVIVGGAAQIAASYKNGLLETFTEEELPNIKYIPENLRLRAEDGKYIGMPLYSNFYGIAYASDFAKKEDFSSWNTLSDPSMKNRISLTRPLFLAQFDLTMYSRINGGDSSSFEPGLDMLKGNVANLGVLYSSMASLMQQLARGEVLAAPFYSSQIAQMKTGGATGIDVLLPEEGGLAITYLLGIPKGAQHKDAALKFLNSVVLDAQGQRESAALAGRLPVNPEITLDAQTEENIGYPMTEIHERAWGPNWLDVVNRLDERVAAVEEILAG